MTEELKMRFKNELIACLKDKGLDMAIGCWNVGLLNTATLETRSTQGDLHEYDIWYNFINWAVDDISEMNLDEPLDKWHVVTVDYAGIDDSEYFKEDL